MLTEVSLTGSLCFYGSILFILILNSILFKTVAKPLLTKKNDARENLNP